MAMKRKFSTFSLSFLDIMSCGFGAVILVFLIIKHDVDTQVTTQNQQLLAEVKLLDQEVLEGEQQLVAIKNTISLLDQKQVETNGLARQINDDIEALDNMIVKLDQQDEDQQILILKQKLKTLTQAKNKLEQEQEQGNDARRISGEGERQYLTGLKLGGARVLILLDSSASMLDKTIINIIRRKNMADDAKRKAKKWQRAIRTVEWLIAKLPLNSKFQLYSFNTEVTATAFDTTNQWLDVSSPQQLNEATQNLHQVIPTGGTSLEKAFRSISFLDPLPDNIILITDGLPTQGMAQPKSNKISGRQREKLFEVAVNTLPSGIPVNVLLWPMEGDPMAASAFWQLAQHTSGSFMSPSRDWP